MVHELERGMLSAFDALRGSAVLPVSVRDRDMLEAHATIVIA